MADTDSPNGLKIDSAGAHAHGTHGKGDMREELLEDRPSEPGNQRAAAKGQHQRAAGGDDLTSEMGDASFGSAGAGDSTYDARKDKKA